MRWPSMDNPRNFHKCNLCGYRTESRHSFLNHVRQHGGKSKNHLFICGLHSSEQYQCEKCPFQSDLKVVLTEHFDTVHRTKDTQHYPTPDLRYCANCDFKTYSSLVLLSHDNYCDGRRLLTKDKNSVERVKGEKHSNQKEDGFFYCIYCSYKFTRNEYLKVHLRERHTPADQIKWFKCGHCPHKTKRKQKLREHILAKHSQPADLEKLKRFKCDQCSYKARRGNHLRVHILVKHTPSEQIDWFKCDQCSYKTVRKGDLKAHIRRQHLPSEQINWFNCKHCSHKTKQKAHLNKHMRTIHGEILESKELKLSYKSVKNTSLREHQGLKRIQSHRCKALLNHESQPRPSSSNHSLFTCNSYTPEEYDCQKCKFQSDLKVLLTEHFDTVHCIKETEHYPTPVLRYCAKCDFETYSSLILLSHDNCCDRSGVNAKDEKLREFWKGIKHTNQQTGRPQLPSLHTDQKKKRFFHCSHCSYISTRNGDLKFHLLQKHTPADQIKWFKCEHCPHKTKRKQKLREHVLAKHSQPAELEKLKRFKCDQCPYKARRPNHLRMHILVKHTPSEQINWNKCNKCLYKTRRSGDLKLHMRQQHGPSEQIKWFKCERCSYKAKRKEHLSKHTLARHAETLERKELKYFKCDQCSYKSVISSNVRRHMIRKHSP